MHARNGGTVAGFESAFSAGYDKAAQKFKGASESDRQRACAQLEQMQQMSPEQLMQLRPPQG